jgi:hypothetical protein
MDESEGSERMQVLLSCIRADGALDYPDTLLAELDLVAAAVQSTFLKSRARP